MSKILIVALALAAGLAACTKRNPAACCITAEQCATIGFPEQTLCAPGLACDGFNCIEPVCSRPSDCIDPTLPFCVDGLCLACDSAGDLGCGPDQPVCDPGTTTCGPCATPDDCLSHPGTPICSQAGACIECTGPTDCANPTPVCDGGDCRGCSLDAECPSSVCNLDTGGCVDPAQVVYLAVTGSDVGTCTLAAPCATLTYALQQTTTSRSDLLMMPGTYTRAAGFDWGAGIGVMESLHLHGYGATWEPELVWISVEQTVLSVYGGQLTVSGLRIRQTNTGPPALNASAFYCDGTGSLRLRDVLVETAFRTVQSRTCNVFIERSRLASDNTVWRSIEVDGGQLELRRSVVDDGGLQLSNADFELTNNLITRNGITISNCHGTASFNTIADTTLPSGAARALECGGSAPPRPGFDANVIWSPGGTASEMATGSCIITNNLIGPIVTPGDGGNFAMDPRFINASGGNYHLAPLSPAIDIAGTGPATDVDGDARPQGAGWDLGADEVVP